MNTWAEQRAKLEIDLDEALREKEIQYEKGDIVEQSDADMHAEDCYRKLKAHLEKQDQD